MAKVRRATPDTFYNTWTHAYGIHALVEMLDRRPHDAERRQRIRALIEHQIGMLERYEVVDGGWAYYDFNARTQKPSGSTLSFVTAAVLVSLHEAKEAGIDSPQRLIDRATASIRRQRKPDFSYFYGEYLKYRPMMPVNRPGGSVGRSQACNFAMRLWGDRQTTDAVIKTWLDRLFARNLWLDIGRKRPIPHESWFQVAGYFFYFGHYYAARCIELLPERDRPPFQDQLAHVLLRLQEKDGSWWDFPLYDYHQQYGTAFALMSLHRTLRTVPPPVAETTSAVPATTATPESAPQQADPNSDIYARSAGYCTHADPAATFAAVKEHDHVKRISTKSYASAACCVGCVAVGPVAAEADDGRTAEPEQPPVPACSGCPRTSRWPRSPMG